MSSPRTSFFQACRDGRYTDASSFLASVVSSADRESLKNVINTRFPNGLLASTPLIAACRKGRYDVVALLLDHGADLNIWEEAATESVYVFPLNALFYAVQKGTQNHHKIVDLLLSCGASVDDLHPVGNKTLLMEAVRAGDENLTCVKSIIRHGASVRAVDRSGRSALSFAATSNCPRIVSYLLDCGALINHVDGDGRTPLFDAAYVGSMEALQTLLERGADLEFADRSSENPILSISSMNPRVCKILVDHGANPHRCNPVGRCPIGRGPPLTWPDCRLVLLSSIIVVD